MAVMWMLAALVTADFHFVLKWLGNASLWWSTLSITTSFVASWLTLMRSPGYALAYAANDLVLIVLWVTAAAADLGCIAMAVCFAVLFLNDSYGFVNWRRMMRRQQS
ncbi:MAG: nicotinamide mononucleotide transporter [Clostridia bacterium]|nr:nicotinamide mononucleotide transporter [Clostridia bacterium]